MRNVPVQPSLRHRHWYLSTTLALALIITTASACSRTTEPPKNQSTQLTASSGGSITIDLAAQVSTLDPGMQYGNSDFAVYRNIYDQLLRRDPKTHDPIPWIANEWKAISPVEWQFTIRDDVHFADGTLLTASDVAFSINRILDKNLASPQYGNFSSIKTAKAGTDTDLTIVTNAPSPVLLSYLTTLSIVSEKYAKSVGNTELATKPMGSGAYKLDSVQGGTQYTLSRNDTYWHGRPSISTVIFRVVPDPSTRLADLQSGGAALVMDLSPDQAKTLSGANGIKALPNPTEAAAMLYMNTLADTPTKDLQIRQAISHAINVKSMIENLFGGYAAEINAPLTSLSFGYPVAANGIDYNPDKARALLAAAGTPHPVLRFATSPKYPSAVVESIQSDLQAVGFVVTIEKTDHNTFLKKIQSTDHSWGSIAFIRWTCSCLDADGTVNPLFHSGTLWSSYSNPKADALIDDARSTTDKTQRLADYDGLFKILTNDLPALGLYQNYVIYGASGKLQWTPDPTEAIYVDQMSLSSS